MFSASDSTPPISVTVSPEPSTTTVKALTADANGNPIPFTTGPYGTFVYIRADVMGQSGNGTATGTVTIKDNSSPITGSPFTLNSQGNTATPNGVFTFTGGSHTITATYSGDASFTAGPAGSATITITPAVTSMPAVSVPSTGELGASILIFASLTGTSCGNPATGTFTFFAGITQIGNSLVQSSINKDNCSLSGSGAISTSMLSQGNNTITAKYSGDTNYAASTAPASIVDVQMPTATALTASALTINQSQSVTLTATITPAQAGPPVGGTVRFQGTPSSCSAGVTNSIAQCALSSLLVGPQVIEAFYSGDTNYQPSIAEVMITVNPGPDFSIAANPSSITIATPGQSGSTMLMLTATNGLTGTFPLTPQCVNLPAQSACSVSPASVTFSSMTTTASVMLTVTTIAPSSVAPTRRLGPPMSPGHGEREAFGLCLLALLSILYVAGKRKRLEVALSIVVFAGLLAFAACGGGGGGVHNPGTPVGLDSSASVSLTLGTATHSVPFSVNVQ
jgi:hypothetical protein